MLEGREDDMVFVKLFLLYGVIDLDDVLPDNSTSTDIEMAKIIEAFQ